MALEDILVFFQLLNHGGQRRMELHACWLSIFQITDGNIVLLCLDIKQTVDGNREVIPSNICIVDGYRYILLLLSRVAQQFLHPVSQASVILDANRQRGYDDTNDHRPIQELEENLSGDRIMENKGEQKEIADGDEEYQSKYGTSIMPNAPGLYSLVQTPQYPK